MVDEISTVMASCQGKSVLLRLRNTKTIQGILIDFDIHMNLTLENAEDKSSPSEDNATRVPSVPTSTTNSS